MFSELCLSLPLLAIVVRSDRWPIFRLQITSCVRASGVRLSVFLYICKSVISLTFHTNVFSKTLLADTNQIGMRHQGNEALTSHIVLDFWIRPAKRAWGQYWPQNPACFKIFLSKYIWPNGLKLICGFLEHVWMFSCARHDDWPPLRGLRCSPI